MKKQAGFTLIELVMVIVILGILGAVAVPKFIDLSGSALTAAKAGMSGAVKSGHAVGIAEVKGYPTLQQLVKGDSSTDCGTTAAPDQCGPYVQGEGVDYAAGNAGVSVTIDGTLYTVPTFTDTGCSTATSDINGTDGTVRCVGSIL